MVKKLSKYMNGYWKYVFCGTIAMIIEVACELMLPSLMARIVDDGIPNGNKTLIIKLGAAMVGLALVGMLGGITCAKFSAVASQGFAAQVRGSMFNKITDFSFHNIDTFSTASLTTRLTNDVTNLQMMIMMSLRILVRAPAMLILAASFAISINKELSAVILFVLPVILIAVGLIMKFGYPMFRKLQKKIDGLNSTVQENLIGIRVVKAYVREDHEKEKFKLSNDNLMKIGQKAAGLIVLAMPVMMLIFNACTLTLIWQGGEKINMGEMKTGELVSLISYVVQILMSLIMVAMILIQVVRSKACAERINEVLETEIDILSGTEQAEESKNNGEIEIQSNENDIVSVEKQMEEIDIKGKVEFHNVGFKYRTSTTGDEILTDINLAANPGEVVAIIGGTGSGKSSLVSLIPRLYDVSSGEVLVDGVDVRNYNLEALRDKIGVVLQKNTLFSGTIKENLLWGNKDATDEDLKIACDAACASEFIENQPDGYDTYLTQGGLNLSGGQKQRLCIARAMVKKPSILILDDSTSAVDTATETVIRDSFDNSFKDTTVFIIAQRISSVEHADKIVILDDGKIVAIGKHDELLQSSEIYQEINATQQKGVLS